MGNGPKVLSGCFLPTDQSWRGIDPSGGCVPDFLPQAQDSNHFIMESLFCESKYVHSWEIG